MKILNLFCGIGGNRTLWGNKHEITAIEYDQRIASIYLKRFSNDIVIVGDAYQYFLNNFEKFDFVWGSPPCTSHSRLVPCIVRNAKKNNLNYNLKLLDLRLYSLIIFLNRFFKKPWIVENVMGYYKPLINPNTNVGRHFIWTNIQIPKIKSDKSLHLSFSNLNRDFRKVLQEKGIEQIEDELMKIERKERKRTVNNCMQPELGKYILDNVIKKEQKSLEDFL